MFRVARKGRRVPYGRFALRERLSGLRLVVSRGAKRPPDSVWTFRAERKDRQVPFGHFAQRERLSGFRPDISHGAKGSPDSVRAFRKVRIRSENGL
jgi:hypothetical protein